MTSRREQIHTHAVETETSAAQSALAESARAHFFAQRKMDREEQAWEKTVQRARENLTADEFDAFAEMVDAHDVADFAGFAAVAYHATLMRRPGALSKTPPAPPERKNITEYRRWLTADEKTLLSRYLPEKRQRNSINPMVVLNWLIWRQNKDLPMVAIPAEHYERVDRANRRWAKTGVWRMLADEIQDETSDLYTTLDSERLEELRVLCKAGCKLGGRAGDRAADKQARARAADAALRAS